MAQRYLLPCTNCDQKIAIETTQAGQLIHCSGCKTEIKIGTLREIRALSSADPDSGSQTVVDRTTKMSVTNRAIFVISAVMTVAGLIWGLMTMLEANRLDRVKIAEALSETRARNLRNSLKLATPSEMMKMWNDVHEDAVAEWVEHPSLKVKRFAREKRLISWIGFGVAGVGILGGIGSVMFTGSQKRPRAG